MSLAIHLGSRHAGQIHQQQIVGWPILGMREGAGGAQVDGGRAVLGSDPHLRQLRPGSCRRRRGDGQQQENTQQLL